MTNPNRFQTPTWVCDIMSSLVEGNPKRILEPTPGQGNLVNSLRRHYPTADIVLGHDILTLQSNEPVGDFMAMIPVPVDLGSCKTLCKYVNQQKETYNLRMKTFG